MEASKRVARLIVIEFGNRANRSPRACGVAVLARNVQVSMRAMRTSRNLRARRSRDREKQQHQSYTRFQYVPNPSTEHVVPLVLAPMALEIKGYVRRMNGPTAIGSPIRLPMMNA